MKLVGTLGSGPSAKAAVGSNPSWANMPLSYNGLLQVLGKD